MNTPVIKRILVPVDFSEITGSVIEHGIFLTRLLQAEMIIMHVVHVPPIAEASTWLDPVISPSVEQDIGRQMKAAARARLDGLAGQCREAGVEAEVILREGVPFAEILKAAEDAPIDLIVLGSHGRTGLSHFLIGSVAERVVRRARRSVFCIKAPTSDDAGE